MANNPFRRYDGIQLRPRYSADPAQGKYGEMYYNTTVNRVRVVVNEAPLTWADLSISPGTINDTTLRWNGTTWAENSSIRATAAGSIYAPDAATGSAIELASGNATTNDNDGGAVTIRTGLGLGTGVRGIAYLDTEYAQAINDAVALTIRGGLATVVNNDGGNIFISGGTGNGTGQKGIAGLAGRYSEMQGDYYVRINSTGTVDPTAIAPTQGGMYLNTGDSRFRWYDGINWRYLDEKGIEVVDLRDDVNVTLPASAPASIDGVTVVTGDDVLFTALTLGKGIYRATVTGPSITWALRKVLKDPTGASFTEGDTVWVGNGTSFGNAMYNYNGTQWATVGNGPGSVIGAPLIWQGAFWAENPDLTLFGTVITPTPDTAPDAFPGATLTVRGGDKTAGTGNGGPLFLNGGNPGTGVAQAYGWFVYSAQPTAGDQIFIDADGHTATWSYVVGAPGPFQIEIGATLNDTLINTQAAIGAEFTAAELTVSYNPPDTIIITAGSSYPGASANGLFQLTETSATISVTNTDGSGYFNNGVTGSPGLLGYVKINGYTIRMDAQHASDPVGGIITDVYYNTVENRFKYFDGTIWRPLGSGSGGTFVAQYIDTATTTLPAATPFSPDGTPVVTDDLVLFTALTNPADNNRVYKATVSGPSVTWQLQIFGQSPTSVPTDGDSVYITLGTTNADTYWFFNGTTWYNILGGAANRTLSNLTSPTAINQDLLPSADNTRLLGSTALTWSVGHIQILRGTTGADSVGVQARRLADTSGNTSIDWQGRALVFGGGNRLTWGTSVISLSVDQEFANSADHSISIPALGGASGRNLSVIAGNTSSFGFSGGNGILRGGNGDGGNSTGATITAQGGQVSGIGGAVTLAGGAGTGGFKSGSINLTTVTSPGFADSGDVVIATAQAGGGGFGSSATWSGGKASGVGGGITMAAGNGVAGNFAGGAVSIASGNGTGTANSGDIAIQTGSVASGTRGTVLIDGSAMRLGTASVYAEFVPLTSFAIAASQTNATVFSYVAATYKTIFIEYQVVRNGATAAGYMQIANDGSTTAWSGNADDTGATGVTFDAVISGANVLLRYTSDANGAGTMKYHVRRW